MRKPRLTGKVLRGLVELASVYDADSPGDFLGFSTGDGDTLEERRVIADADAASDWIGKMAAYRASRKRNGAPDA